ncbi:MAG: hypothetical protein K9N11_09350 [Lentisphaeria bacterium]|nr:hypothetical protein [Candidatus Neomarinimicrobiota bacterium]MCF7843043.1 hypothetical protein [Lentisphaeria bacterium]
MARRINPILIINGIFLVVMMLLFARFVNTGALFQELSSLEKLSRHLTGYFITPDSAMNLQGILLTDEQNDGNEQVGHHIRFTVSPPLPAPWSDGWTFRLSQFGPLEILAEGYGTTGKRWSGCEMVFQAEDEMFTGETIGTVCSVDSVGVHRVLSLRTAADSLIFATRRIARDGVEDFSRQIVFLRWQSPEIIN